MSPKQWLKIIGIGVGAFAFWIVYFVICSRLIGMPVI